ncbi:sigma 54-dependent transcriptional regulator, partial [Escherichia coli]|nr:sigma 54-dependent transcriptional regulator [Escherichia coli]
DLRQLVAEGKFREDLYARINLWTFTLPGLRQRQEDIEPNLDYEVERHATLTGDSVRFNTEARRAWLAFATSPQATWRGNFRELSASVTRMATFATSGRITLDVVEDEINRLRYNWQESRLPCLRSCWALKRKISTSLIGCNWNTLSLSAARQSRFLLPDDSFL